MVDPQEHYYRTLLHCDVAPLQTNGPQSPQVVLDVFVEYLRTLLGEASKMPAQTGRGHGCMPSPPSKL